MSGEDIQTQKSIQYLKEVETVAQDLLTAKESKLELANAHNRFREALRALEHVEDRRSWMKVGNLYIERPTQECKAILNQEITNVTIDLDQLHDEIKKNMYRLKDLEHEPRLEGFSLKPISVAEAKALHKGFGV